VVSTGLDVSKRSWELTIAVTEQLDPRPFGGRTLKRVASPVPAGRAANRRSPSRPA
jgi:hypothetical protein